MSKTIRWTSDDPNWGPGTPDFDKRFPNVRTKKHQGRDRAPEQLYRQRKALKHGKISRAGAARRIDRHDLAELGVEARPIHAVMSGSEFH
jgi:hypothetical protein